MSDDLETTIRNMDDLTLLEALDNVRESSHLELLETEAVNRGLYKPADMEDD